MSEELKKMLRDVQARMRQEGVDFILAVIVGTTDHRMSVGINSHDAHHTLDMLTGIMKCWSKSAHKE